jgi:hypothetical protein
MKIRDCLSVSARHQFLRRVILASTILSAAFVSTDGCQGRDAALAGAAKVLLDSSLAANEALYDSSTANLAMDRLACLESRAKPRLGHDEVLRIATEADRTVRKRHSRAEFLAGDRGIEMLHDAPTTSNCRRIDSLWYALVTQRRKARP